MYLEVGQHNGVNEIFPIDFWLVLRWDVDIAAPGALIHLICSPLLQHQKRIVLSSELLQSIRL